MLYADGTDKLHYVPNLWRTIDIYKAICVEKKRFPIVEYAGSVADLLPYDKSSDTLWDISSNDRIIWKIYGYIRR